MKIILSIVLIFIAVLITEGILLPSLFHVYGGFLGFAFLASLLIVYGAEHTILILGLLASLFLEMWHGFYFTSVILAWLSGAVIWSMLKHFFSVEPLIEYSRISLLPAISLLGIGYILVASMSIIFLAVGKYIYRGEMSWTTLRLMALSPTIWLITGFGLILCMSLMRLPGRKSMPSAGKFYI